jgi:hypothetical protein
MRHVPAALTSATAGAVPCGNGGPGVVVFPTDLSGSLADANFTVWIED